jgi:hypothetical protein
MTASEFKKRYKRLYKHIMSFYGKADGLVHSPGAAIELWKRGDPCPTCSVCGKKVTISNRFLNPVVDVRCAQHVNTNNIVTHDEIHKANKHQLEIVSIPKYPAHSSEITVKCAQHGQYIVTVKRFLQGANCQQCYHASRNPRYDFQAWVDAATKAHNSYYDYSSVVEYNGLSSSVTITCPKHGKFVQNAGVHKNGHGCPECAKTKLNELRYTPDAFIDAARLVHCDAEYDYSCAKYAGCRSPVTIVCPKHGEFTQIAYYHLNGNGCPQCGIAKTTNKSAAEYEIIEFLKSSGVNNIEHSWRGLGFEVDIYLPDYKLGIEYNGVYWHSSNSLETDKKHAKQHVDKTNSCNEHGIELLHILDIEWKNKQDLWKSVILNKLKQSSNVVYARACDVVQVPNIIAYKFFEQNHLQGGVYGSVNIGLEHNNELVAVASFGKSRFRKDKTNTYELLRFASLRNYSVVGGFSRVLKRFARTHNGILVSYANRRWSTGHVYKTTGFELVKTLDPCYYYTDLQQIWHRTSFQKHKLHKLLNTFDPAMTEVENMYNNKYRRIWDCGHYVYEINLNEL